MESEDDPTIRFYAENAETYADYWLTPSAGRLGIFLAHLQPGAEILELGCGNGRDSAFMIEHGYSVMPTDGVAAMAEEATRRLGVPVAVLRFENITAVEAFDGIWAHACLLHVPRSELPSILARIHRALRPRGLFYASYKSGEEDKSDRFGRYYNYPSREWLETQYRALPWSSLTVLEGKGGGYDDQPSEWLHVTATKP